MPVPEFIFHDDCDHHDFNYWLGGSEEDRERADREFLEAMLRSAGDNPAYQTLAFTYWMAVRLFGGICFHYGKERDENDLELALRKIGEEDERRLCAYQV